MEINKKLRGQKHHHNKARYQNKAKVIPKTSSEKDILSKNKDTSNEQIDKEKGLTNNWHRYEESSEEEKIDESTNFALLAQAPISHGGHFQFKSDKNVESEFDFETLRKNKMFALDLYLLESGLSTIPFHERCSFDKSYFTENQLKKVNKRSQQNKVQYENYLKINSITKEFLTQTPSDSENKEVDGQHINKDIRDDIETLLTAKVQPNSIETESTNIAKEVSDGATDLTVKKFSANNGCKEDKQALEEWLDDILND